ncbi:hypothetical protein EI94DRAFT_662348 [Lactarius quietus]|nr:hypothetical protein EI94DRAFT_662348 [Lactarius quietus]
MKVIKCIDSSHQNPGNVKDGICVQRTLHRQPPLSATSASIPVSLSSACSRIVKAMSAFTLYCNALRLPCTVTSCLSLRVLCKSQFLDLKCIHLPLPLNSVCCRLLIVATCANYEHHSRTEAPGVSRRTYIDNSFSPLLCFPHRSQGPATCSVQPEAIY